MDSGVNTAYTRIGIIGAGTMGTGLAVDVVLRGMHAVLVDTSTFTITLPASGPHG